MFKPFIDQKTRDKVQVCSDDFLPALEEWIDLDEIPQEYGGRKTNITWSMKGNEEDGTSKRQLRESFLARLPI